MTIYIPTWLYWYAGMPLAFILGYLLGRLRKPAVPPDPYLRAEWSDAELDEYAKARGGVKRPVTEAPTTKRARPTGARDEGES